MRIFGVPAHRFMGALLLLGTFQLGISMLADKTTGKLTHGLKRSIKS